MMEHVDYPHEPGTLYDCEACEAECFCTYELECVACAILRETIRADREYGCE